MSSQSVDYVRPENLREVERARADFRNMTLDDVASMAERLPWGTPQEVTERIIAMVDRTGANTIQVMMNAGAMPHEMYIEQIRRFARDVLPALQAHQVTRVPVAEEALA
jgi:alkanesulfonate monooxygenase SsuD/methylene tetrahydromethanopterin reductase-like flavin-dependent oxidoreductase (luciferase family)